MSKLTGKTRHMIEIYGFFIQKTRIVLQVEETYTLFSADPYYGDMGIEKTRWRNAKAEDFIDLVNKFGFVTDLGNHKDD